MRKVLLAATLLAGCSTSVEPTNPYDAASPSARAPVAVTVSLASDDPLARPGWVSCAPATATPCRVTVTLTADASPTALQLSTDPAFPGTAWGAVPAGPQPWAVPLDLPAGADAPVTVYARFRSAAGNVSATFSATVQRKSSAPSAPAVGLPGLVPDGGAYYTNVLPLPLALSAAGADRMRVSCDAFAPLAGQPWVPFNPSQTCVLVAGDGERTLSAEFADEAGNVSSVATATVRLQQTPPPPPAVTLSTGSGTDPGARTVLTSPTTALTTSTQLVLAVNASAAGALLARVDASSSAFLPASATSTAATFSLAQGDAVSDATNLLSVRTVDRAGNVSQPATVTVVHERSGGPAAPTGLTVSTRPGSIQVSWTESVSRYATGYQLSYGPTAGYGGTGADQGASPISVGVPCDTSGACRYVLTGLSNFEPEHLALTALSELQAGGTATAPAVTPQPLGLTALGALYTGRAGLALALADDRAYVVQNDGLQLVDLSSPAAPALLGKAPFRTAIPSGGTSSVAIRWPYAYVAGFDGLYVFDVSDEAAPAERGFYPAHHPGIAGNPVRPVVALALRWPRAYLHVAGQYPSGGLPSVGALLDVVDVGTPSSPARVNAAIHTASYGDYTPGGGYQGAVTVVGNTAWLGTANNANIGAWDVSGVTTGTPGTPPAWIAGSVANYGYPTSHLAADLGPRRLVYAMEGSASTLHVFDYTTPGSPVEVGTAPGVPNGKFSVAGGDVYLASSGLLEVVDLANLSNPAVAGTMASLPWQVGGANAVAVSGTLVVVAGSSGLGVLQAAHLQYPQARGQAPSLGGLTGGARVEVRGRIAIVPGNGVALYDVGNPAAPAMVASNDGNFATGSDYVLGYGFAGGAALSGDLLLSAYGTQCNSGSGLVAFDLGRPYSATTPAASTFPCVVARTPVLASGCDPVPRYYGLSAHGGYLFAAKGGTAGSWALDVYDLGAFTPYASCAYVAGFPAGPSATTSFALAGDPRDVQVHRRWAFVAEADGLEILDVASPVAPVRKLRQGGLSGVSALAVRLGRCGLTPCYHVFLATSAGVQAYSWDEVGTTLAPVSFPTVLGGAASVLAAHGAVVQGHTSTGGLGVFDDTTLPPTFQSYSTPKPSGAVSAIGAAGRFLYANDGGSFVVQELQ
jgi:hypothetical protein